MISVISSNVTATTKEYTVTLTERLCKPFCINSSIQPSVNVVYSIDSTKLVGTILYVTIKAQGTATYVSKNGSACCPCTKIFTEYFTVSFNNATCATCPNIKTIPGFNFPAYVNCCNVACGISQSDVVIISIVENYYENMNERKQPKKVAAE